MCKGQLQGEREKEINSADRRQECVSKKNCYIGSNESDNYSDKIGEDSNVFPLVERDEEIIGKDSEMRRLF